MTILNAFLSSTQAVICVNTEVVALDGALSQRSKLIALPHMNAALAGRGGMTFFAHVVANCLTIGGADLDFLIAKMPELLELSFNASAVHAAALGVAVTEADGQQIVLAGWSAQLNKMLGFSYEQTNRDIGFSCRQIQHSLFAPGWDAMPNCDVVNRELLARCAMAQRRQLQKLESEPGKGSSGDSLIAAQIERDSMSLMRVCDLD